MGLFTASAPAQLHPVNPPLGVFPQFCVNVPTTLVLKEKAFSFSGDDFAVKDSNGVPVVRCKGKALSFRDRKVITDSVGKPLFHLRNKVISIHKTFVAEDDGGNEIFRVTKRMSYRVTPSTSLNSTSHAHRHPRRYHSRATVFPAAAQDPRHHASRASSQLTSPVGTKMQATFRNHSTGQEVTLELRGDMWGGSADISMGGMPVAQITRQLFNMREVFADKQTYFVTVAPGVDLALIAAICICFDEAKNESD
ncbi:hypothetical protein EHS25_005394 [Saitozyma podzolica]|uniref:Phospholipid scramblase n=1 Tax=Saitozyma podzolica TaxID=1890683 RepID=A0A427XY55_9TREE|nr:hypothetical protein EHS25_005394 [Saitozyma podzolica]